MDLWQFIKPLGIITYVLLIVTVLSGMMRWKFKYHKILGVATLVMATAHVLIVIFH